MSRRDARALGLLEARMPAVHFLLRGGDQSIDQVIGLNAEAAPPGDLDVGLDPVVFGQVIAQLLRAARRKRHHVVGKMRVVLSLGGVAQRPQRIDDVVLRVLLAGVDDVVDFGHFAEVRMVCLALFG